MTTTTEIWQHNLVNEFDMISAVVYSPYSSYICLDTEFPGFVYCTPLGASSEQRYIDMKCNVEMMKIIQLGFTFYNKEGQSSRFSWQVNFRGFDPTVDTHAENSIRLLRSSGIDFERNQRDGVDQTFLSRLVWQKLIRPCRRRNRTRWITFHGLYDLGYIVKLLIGSPLPDTLPEFLSLARTLLGNVYDLKHIARFCGFNEKMGLIKIAEKVGVNSEGRHHQAGHDSMLIGEVFWRMKEMFGLREDDFMWMIHGAELGNPALMMRWYQPYHSVPMTLPWGFAPPGCFAPPSFNHQRPPHGFFYASLPYYGWWYAAG